MTAPLPPALAALVQARQPAAEGVLGAAPGPSRPPATAVVLALTRQGALIESGGKRWLMSGATPLPHGAKLTLEQGAKLALEPAAAGAAPHSARLLSIGPRALAPPVAVQLQPVISRPGETPSPESVPRGAGAVEAEARLIGPTGRPLGPPVPITLSAGPPASPEAARSMPSAGAGGSATPSVAPPAAGTAQPSATTLSGAPASLARPAAPPLPAAQPLPQIGVGCGLAGRSRRPRSAGPPAAADRCVQAAR